ncbi:MAG: aspartate-semialdehyde dehydrogenase [Verrucomicrobia subdivision 6 bacterium BACL9 MAG-120820-bin42]|uniref:Aspartate-semialdehyde dehydrogenase n=1 Tax=Verrucomicrobia subdivision 6 bacterium BACL9 MAG-120820-bin42 TaxID=1655634 RepID=A0A0R2X806_9BACT|nr:MAG: aspartate-semialdehyde dehydrogenase [Verrucomicrobia subdivision 6 bacterium BACL9 MAG-120820-bin42]
MAVVGVTGAVGQEILRVLERRKFPVSELVPLASERSAGTEVEFAGKKVKVRKLEAASFAGVEVAFFSAGATRSREFIPIARKAGAVVVDNSSAFRMNPEVPLVVPEVNGDLLDAKPKLIANPNCSAAILAVALAPLHQLAGLESVVVATYQSASGAGAKAMAELEQQVRDYAAGKELKAEVFPHVLAFNLFSHNSPMGKDGYNEEEQKMVEETRKIFGLPKLRMVPTCVRVPVPRAHSEAVVARFLKPISLEAAKRALEGAAGVRLVDEPKKNLFPMPSHASGELDVFVGRVREVEGDPHSIAFFVSGDQLLKGAAWNAAQIAEELAKRGGLPA